MRAALLFLSLLLAGCAAHSDDASPATAPSLSLTGAALPAAMPVFSPGNTHMLLLPREGGANALEIWKRDESGDTLEWAYTQGEAARDLPPGILERGMTLNWRHSGRIELAFQNFTATITRDETGWHLRVR